MRIVPASGQNVVDSSGWLEYFADSDAAAPFVAALEDTDRLLVPVVTIYEVFKFTRRHSDEDEARRVVQTMRRARVIPLDVDLALAAACNGLPLADSLIYATTLAHGATLWTQDAHFEGLYSVRYFPKP